MIIMIIAEISGRRRQSPVVLGGEGESPTKGTLSIGPVVSLAAVFWMSRNAPPKEWLLTSELHSFLIVLAVCLRTIEQTNHIPENLNDVRFRATSTHILNLQRLFL